MKKTIFAGVAAIAIATSVCAQGTLSLSSSTGGSRGRITVDGLYVVSEDNIWIQVLVAGATSLTGSHTFHLAPFLGNTGNNAGALPKTVLTVNAIPGGSAVDVTIRAWDKDFGPTYDQTPDQFRASQTLFAFVLGGIVDANGIAGLPNSIIPPFTGLNIRGVPEPSTCALAAIGFGALRWIGRKKE